MSKRVLIFGYSGFVGPYLAKEFEKDGYIAFGSDIIEPFSNENKNFTKCDILVFEEVDSLIKRINPDVIINLAAISSVGQSWIIPQKTILINVIGSLNILESIKKFEKKPKVLFVGSSEEYEVSEKPISEADRLNANNPYGISKTTQEALAKIYRERFGIKIYCVRAFNHIGIGQSETFAIPSFCKQVANIEKTKKSGEIFVGNLDICRDFSDVRDVVVAYKMVINSDDDTIVYNIGSGKSYCLRDLLNFIVSLSKQKIRIVVDDQMIRPVDAQYVCCDNSLIVNKLGWKCEHDIKDTLKSIYFYYLNDFLS